MNRKTEIEKTAKINLLEEDYEILSHPNINFGDCNKQNKRRHNSSIDGWFSPTTAVSKLKIIGIQQRPKTQKKLKNSSSLGRFPVSKNRPFSQAAHRNANQTDNKYLKNSKSYKKLEKFMNFQEEKNQNFGNKMSLSSHKNCKPRYIGLLPYKNAHNTFLRGHQESKNESKKSQSQKNSFYISGKYRSKKAPQKPLTVSKSRVSLNITNLKIEIDHKIIRKYEKKKLSQNRNNFIHEKLKRRPKMLRTNNIGHLLASRIMKPVTNDYDLGKLKNKVFFSPKKRLFNKPKKYILRSEKLSNSANLDPMAIYNCEY